MCPRWIQLEGNCQIYLHNIEYSNRHFKSQEKESHSSQETFFIGKGFNQFCRGGKPVLCLELCYGLAYAGASVVFVNEKFTTKVCHALVI